MLCRACLLCGAPQGHLSSSVSAVSFIKPQRQDQDRHRTYLHGSEETQTALCVYACVCGKLEGMRESWWACHLWICSSKLIFGPASSSLWTENLKPTDSWAREWRKHKMYKKHVTGGRGGQLRRDDREERHLYIKGHINV